jgi:Sulfotransferase family
VTVAPTFLLVGANRAATTTLYHHLGQHPEVFVSPVKEPMYFLTADGTSIGEYVASPHAGSGARPSWDGYLALFTGAAQYAARGEASTLYLHNSKVAAATRHLPGLRIIALLRQPADRAFSNYVMHRQWGVERLPTFEAALAAEPERVASGWAQAWHYLALSRYATAVGAYLDIFGANRMRVFLFEDLVADPAAVVREAYAFLGVDPNFPVDASVRHNQARVSRAQMAWRATHGPLGWTMGARAPRTTARIRTLLEHVPALDSVTRRMVTERCRSDIDELSRLLDRDLSGWLAPPSQR